MTQIELRNVDKYFGDFHVINNVNLTVEKNEFIVFLGESGCGKTTTLRSIAGLETIDSGEILIDGIPVQDKKAETRDIAFVFQSFALYPHMTVYENMAFPLRATGVSKSEIDLNVRRVADILQITPLLNRRPSAISGGDMQRTAIGRALVRNPKALLMDEPIGALDARLREDMRIEIKRLHVKQGSTTIYVTHDQTEAMSLADRIVIMHDGTLQQIGSPQEVYENPINLFVAEFVGSPVMNVSDVLISEHNDASSVILGDSSEGFSFPKELTGQLDSLGATRESIALGIRPESIDISLTGKTGYIPVEAHIIEPLGSHDIIDLKIGSKLIRARTPSGFVDEAGTQVWAKLDPTQTHFFDTSSGRAFGVKL
jgi:multiple sugar transport system ATP-binding protein